MKDSPTGATKNLTVPEPIKITAVTWNLGNQTASQEAVSAVIDQILPDDGTPPVVVGVATQEELASTGKRLHEQVADGLNKRLGLAEGERYRVVYVDSHKTYAGFNNMLKDRQFSAFAEIIFTSNNQVSNAVIVKEPYEFENPESKIYYESGATRSNKSIIRIKGTLKKDNEPIMDVSIAGTHLNSYKEVSRRDHLSRFLEGEGLSDKVYDSIEELYEDASQFSIFMGDVNERDELMADGSTKNPTDEFALRGFGYDIDRVPHQKIDGKTIHGTYGILMQDGKQVRGTPDAKGRLHCTREGHLDRIACNSGLSVQTEQYGGEFHGENCEFGEKKSYFNGADHFPVTRNFSVTPPNPQEKMAIACDYVLRRIPDGTAEMDELKRLKKALKNSDKAAFLNQLRAMQHFDDTLSPEEYLCQRLDIHPTITFNQMFENQEKHILIYSHLDSEISQLQGVKETMQQHADELNRIKAKAKAKEPITDADKSNIVKIANVVSQYQESLNQSRLIRAQVEITKHKDKKTNIFHRLKRHINKKIVRARKLLTSFYATYKAIRSMASDIFIFGPIKGINNILKYLNDNEQSNKFKKPKALTTQYLPKGTVTDRLSDNKAPTPPTPNSTDAAPTSQETNRRPPKKAR